MKRILAPVILITLGFSASATTMQSAADRIINQVDPATNIGISVVDLTTGETLYQRNSNRSFIPASNMKLFSDAAALMALGPDYHFQTKLTTNAVSLENGNLNGSVFIHLPGDPSLTQDEVKDLLRELSEWGVRNIHGNVVIVSNNRAVDAYAPGWVTKDLKYSYGAPLAPLVLDENRLTVTANPADKPGLPALVELSSPSGITINNQAKTNATGKGCGVGLNMNQDNVLTVSGCVGVGQWSVQQRIAILNPLRYAQEVVRTQLTELGISLNGQVILGNGTGNELLIATHNSKPITELMADTLKPSDNLYADSLFLHAAAKIHGTPLNWQDAQKVVKTFLQQQTGVNLQNAVLTDGSGLSRQDLLTPEQTVGLLKFLHQKFPLSYEYIAALPIAGIDGTLQRRLKLPSQKGLVRAKTGTMTGIIGLSGYLYTANAHTLAFAIFINRTPKTNPNAAGKYRYLVDALCAFFLKQKPQNAIYGGENPHGILSIHQKPTQIQLQRSHRAKWRNIETSIKAALRGQPVTILYRGDYLVLNDNNSDANRVLSALQNLRKKTPFAIALEDRTPPSGSRNQLLWVKANPKGRVWTIKEVV
ncbi:D-alanyl-D-alanine carboxypeptidase (plasmid) [Legionella adelaidensis]|uniref:D-alanyl-D-alanine carboxypeptidase n=1 Tax=Legionella adelaidensis TaxID=45056 RepID=A0A0W0R5U6_9GAMM|nr:D-alanyl-D-alanine carboxypeptidase/D-alanyl-D-alanine-endopeptidase [Legionella adelaidensis]KTC66418.1 D-alanyl-D-alanine carboxypeptidase [Legionella adelaidensis]VEH85016.1 D-alanyl-D-alanine carboxypeptidase [Legionella adelaidensis]